MNTTIVEAVLNNVAILLPVRMVHSYERGVRFRGGRDVAELATGLHWFCPGYESIEVLNTAPETRNLPTQSSYTKDRRLVTYSGNLCYRIVDARKAYTSVQNFDESLVAFAMVHLEESIGKRTLFALQRKREDFDREFSSTMSAKVAEWGAEIEWVGLTDLAEGRAYRLFGDPVV